MTDGAADPASGGGDQARSVARLVDELRLAPERRGELVALLREGAPAYRGLGTRDAERLRGYVLASFEAVGLPPEALPFVLEELETGLDPYPVAAAAKALRGLPELPEAAIRPLAKAMRRIAANDDRVEYGTFSPGGGDPRGATALAELARTASAMGSTAAPLPGSASGQSSGAPRPAAPHGCCCAPLSRPPEGPAPADAAPLGALPLEDQVGRSFAFDDFFVGRVSILTFFYTRCMNPEKCSLTITKLARLQRLVREAGLRERVNVAAITYDPVYDRADRLHAYGLDRGMRFDARNKLLRTVGPFEPIMSLFDLDVGFGPATVNRHRLELLVLDARVRVRKSLARVQWSEADVMPVLRELTSAVADGAKDD